jgi:hypothetical protein
MVYPTEEMGRKDPQVLRRLSIVSIVSLFILACIRCALFSNHTAPLIVVRHSTLGMRQAFLRHKLEYQDARMSIIRHDHRDCRLRGAREAPGIPYGLPHIIDEQRAKSRQSTTFPRDWWP